MGLAKLVGILAGIQDETLVKKANTVEHLNNINAKYAELKAQAEEEVKQNEASLKAQIANRDRYVEERQQAIEEKKNKEETFCVCVCVCVCGRFGLVGLLW